MDLYICTKGNMKVLISNLESESKNSLLLPWKPWNNSDFGYFPLES